MFLANMTAQQSTVTTYIGQTDKDTVYAALLDYIPRYWYLLV